MRLHGQEGRARRHAHAQRLQHRAHGPQSLGAGSEPARSDLHHLSPVDELANNARGNLPSQPQAAPAPARTTTAARARDRSWAGVEEVFEVRPVRRGDLARALFYFAVRYDQSIEAFEETALRSWHDSDAPDAVEQARNDAIETYQKNRNPFVDRPDFAARSADH
ncbi:MAG: endonuclease [Myxococcales bacterium]|nr:endonuclease [Myxococcales bacterium]